MTCRLQKEAGQTTVELALCLPFVVVLAALIVEVGLLASDQVRLWHAAREGARIAAVDGEESRIRSAAERSGLAISELRIDPPDANRVPGEPVKVEVTHTPEGRLPLSGALISRLTLRAEATMRIEQP